MVLAAVISLRNASTSGRPMGAVSLLTTSSNDLDETTLNLRTCKRRILPLGNGGPQIIQALLGARLGVRTTLVNVCRGRAVDQETKQFWPAVVAARVHH